MDSKTDLQAVVSALDVIGYNMEELVKLMSRVNSTLEDWLEDIAATIGNL